MFEYSNFIPYVFVKGSTSTEFPGAKQISARRGIDQEVYVDLVRRITARYQIKCTNLINFIYRSRSSHLWRNVAIGAVSILTAGAIAALVYKFIWKRL